MKLNRLISLVMVLIAIGSASALAQSTQAAPAQDKVTDLAPPQHPATADQIREYFALTKSIEAAHTAMRSSLKAARETSAPYYTASFWDDMEKALLEIDLIAPAIPAYQKYFSQEDMAATIAFYKTPVGQRLLDAQPFIVSAFAESVKKAGRDAGEQVGLKHAAEIERLMKQNPPAEPSK